MIVKNLKLDIFKRINHNIEYITNLALEIYVDSCGKKSLGETPQCECTRRLISSPRKAEYISRAGIPTYNIRVFLFPFVQVSIFITNTSLCIQQTQTSLYSR